MSSSRVDSEFCFSSQRRNIRHDDISAISGSDVALEMDRHMRKRGIKSVVGEYANETNFHGFRYIIHAATPIARMIWLLLFLSALAAFLYQVQDRVRMYLSWPVNVNIDIASNLSLIFPAVTICNSNNFRISEAMNLGTYQYITDVFHRRRNWKQAIEKLNDMNYTDLQIKLAHRMEHMILGCTWKSSQCSWTNFTPILTDYGVCYTFNTNKDNILTVENTGAAFGLEILLNMERYEYMTGAHVSTGIRLLMHNHDEKPRMADLGISIPASMNAMVAMELTELNDLVPPHGNCTNADFRSREACIVDCRVDKLADICHCRPMYATYKPNIPLCNATSHHVCVKDVLASHEGYEVCNSKCKVPCKQLMYSASLSYTTTSDFMARALAKKYATDLDLLNRSRIATLNLHHVDDTFLEEDNSVMSAFLDKYHKFYNQLLWLYESEHKNATHIKVMQEVFEEAELCLQQKKSLFEETLRLHLIPGLVELTAERLRYEITDLRRRRFPKYSKLVNQNSTFHNISISEQQKFDEELWWLDHRVRIILSELQLTESTYSVALDEIRVEYQRTDSLIPMSILRPFEKDLINTYSTFVNNTSHAITDVEHFLEFIAQFRRMPNDVNLMQIYNETSEMGTVLTDLSEGIERLESISNVIKEHFRHEIANVQSIEQNIIGSAEFHQRLSQIYATEFLQSRPHLLEFGEFINRTKNLTGGFQIQFLVDELQNSDLWNHTISHTKNMMVTLDKIKAEAKSTILHSGEVLLRLETSSAEFNGTNGCPQFTEITKLLEIYKNEINDQPNRIDSVQKNYDKMLTRHTNLDKHLQDLKDSYAINYKFIKRNFLTVRVFYQKLNFQRITKAEGYQWFSLICDIGGSFGLYLGASLLTLVELVYFIGKHININNSPDKVKSFHMKPHRSKMNGADKQDTVNHGDRVAWASINHAADS